MEKNEIGFVKNKDSQIDVETINRVFSPEFRNRLDSIIRFNHLDKVIIKQIVSKFIVELESQLSIRDISIELTKSASDLICDLGYSNTMGARPIARLIDDKIKKPLANEIIHGKLVEGGAVLIDSKQTEFLFTIKKNEIKKFAKQIN